MITLPLDRVNLDKLKLQKSFSDEDFITQSTYVGIKIGTSKITLSELKNLEDGDIILLEDSDVKRAILISGDFEKSFNIKSNPQLILNLDNDNNEETIQETNNEVIMEKNLWDDIQVEISAEFAKVKMSIGELKQITQGQIVDLGSVFENEISLFVENKKVAKGELVIINDKYAVRLNEVLSSNVNKSTTEPAQVQEKKPQQQATAQAVQKPQEAPQQRPRVQVQDEEFDYSDFEK